MDTWDDLYDDFCTAMVSRYKPTTLRWYQGLLKPLIARQKLDGVTLQRFTRRELERYLAEKSAGGGGRRYIEVIARCCTIFLRYGKQVRAIAINPLAGYEIKKAPKPYVAKPTVEDLQRLLKAINDRWDPSKNPRVRFRTVRERRFIRTRDYALLSGLIESGCRVSEICQLKLADFDARALQIAFRDTKGGEPRYVPISAEWAKIVGAWLKARPPVKDCDTLFMSKTGVPLNKDTVRNQMNEYEKFAGVPHRTRHSLRHFTINLNARTNLQSARLIAGQKSIKVTEGYLYEDAEVVRADHAKAGVLTKVLEKPALAHRRPNVV